MLMLEKSLLLLLLMLALQPTMDFSLFGDFLPFRPFLLQFFPPSYSHRLYNFLNVFISLLRTLGIFREGGPVSFTEFFATF
jgi:hypothetical protein